MSYRNITLARQLPAVEKIALLLGLTEAEFAGLNCSELRSVTDDKGDILQYYIHISPFNPETLLSKLCMNNRRMIYFPPDAFESF